MKPVYLNKKEVPQAQKDEALAKGPGDKSLWALYNREVLMEQELATSEDPLKVKQLIRNREAELGLPLRIQEWAFFNIGA